MTASDLRKRQQSVSDTGPRAQTLFAVHSTTGLMDSAFLNVVDIGSTLVP